MNYKSVSRFFLFTLALIAALAFFGVKPSESDLNKNDFSEIQTCCQSELISIHTPSIPFPEEIVIKEEQPSEEDEDNLDSDEGLGESENAIILKELISSSQKNVVNSNSQVRFHCPLYIRIQSILI